MTKIKMHAEETDITLEIVQELIKTQFPMYADLLIEPVLSAGTENRIYRLGSTMAIRLPFTANASFNIDKEYRWLPQLAPYLPLAIPIPLFKGLPDKNYPWSWYIYNWIEGKHATTKNTNNLHQSAIDLGNFIVALQKINTTNAPISKRGCALNTIDDEFCTSLGLLNNVIDVSKAKKIWKRCLNIPSWSQAPAWIHGDLHPGNLLFNNGKLNAVIDFGIMGIGDPACDMMVAWTLFCADTRNTFRSTVNVDDATWIRGRGWALAFGVIALPYYQNTNPTLATIAHSTINEVLSESV